MPRKHQLFMISFASAILLTGGVAHAATAKAKPAAATVAPSARLAKLFRDSDEASLKRNPISGMFRGDMRYAAHLGDYISDAYFKGERDAALHDLATLKAIDRSRLNATDQIAYDVFLDSTQVSLRGLQPDLMALTVVRPVDHFAGFQTFYPDFASGQGAATFKSVADYENNVQRHKEYAVLIDAAIRRFRQGMASGVTQPKLVVRNVIDQLDLQINAGVEGSPFFAPVKTFPDGISAADRTRLTAATAATIHDDIFPAYVRLRDFLKNEYLPVAREGVGLVHMKGGLKLYDYQIRSNTTLPLTADYVHNLGLSEVKRILVQMEAIKTQVGFKGTLKQFFDYFRVDPKFQFSSKQDMHDTFVAIGKKVDTKVRAQFSTIPRAPLEIRPVPDYLEKTSAGGYYNQGTPDGTRPGAFYFNAYDLPSRSKPESETLYLHEAVPGHHFQISLAQENTALPSFMRFGGNTAYAEGWALYAESLYKEFGLESDPYDRLGGFNDEMLRAMRLVVDSGIHAKGWTRDRAIAYMLDNSGMSKTDAVAEVERYIAIPGQALAYKIGQLTILRLKAKAQAALGTKFDPRAFHAEVLMTGALPMTVLEKKIDAWIAASR
jgi:uncharacterized protein (DUF885 family)